MKIAVWHNLPSGGGKRALHDHVKGLVARGHAVESWCPSTADQTYLPLSEMIPEHIVPLRTVERSRLQTIRRRLAGGSEVSDRVREMERVSRECASQIEQGQFDVLFANSCSQFAAPYVGRYLDMPKVLYLQEPFRFLYEAQPELCWIAPPPAQRQAMLKNLRHLYRDLHGMQAFRIQAREELTNVQAYDTLLANSQFSRESMRRTYGRDAHVCYLGIDTELFQAPEGAREDFVVGIGAFGPHKNIEFIIEAVAATQTPHPRLVWIGNSKRSDYLAALTRQAQAAGVEFEPRLRISDREMTDLLGRAALMAYAPYLEPFGFAPLEANACGAPVVAVAEGGVRETVQDGVNGLLTSLEPRAMAAAIDCLRRDPVYARTLGENGRRLARERWSMAASLDRLEQRLRETVERKSACLSPA